MPDTSFVSLWNWVREWMSERWTLLPTMLIISKARKGFSTKRTVSEWVEIWKTNNKTKTTTTTTTTTTGDRTTTNKQHHGCSLVACLLNIPAAWQCLSGTALTAVMLRLKLQIELLLHPDTAYRHQAYQSLHPSYDARPVAGKPLEHQYLSPWYERKRVSKSLVWKKKSI